MPLGKSLGNILGDYFGEETIELNVSAPTQVATSLAINIPIDQIKLGPFQTRTHFDLEKIKSLAANIQSHGLIHPVVVLSRRTVTGELEYVLLAGERRLRACKLLDWKEILAVVKPSESLSDQQQAMLSAMENLQREDLSPIELAHTFEMLMQTQELDEQGLATMLGHTPQYVKNYLRLTSLCPTVQQALKDRTIGEGQARHLVGLPEDKQIEVLKVIIEQELTVKEIIQYLQKGRQPKPKLEISTKLHNLKPETVLKANRFAQQFPNARLKCSGDEKRGKIVITWDEK